MAGGGSTYKSTEPIGTGRIFFYCIVWLILVIGLSFMNKAVFKWTEFKYPVLLSTVHMIINWLMGSFVWGRMNGKIKEEEEKKGHDLRHLIMYFSLLFVLNIAFGNMSVKAVNLLLSQVFRSSMPIFIMICSVVLGVGSRPSTRVILTVLPIIIGVYLTCKKDDSKVSSNTEEDLLNIKSLAILLIGNIMCALKTTLTNKYLNQYKFHPIYLLSKLSMWSSFGMFAFAAVTGEVSDLFNNNLHVLYNVKTVGFVISTGFVAFLLNYFNFLANSSTSPLTMGICGLLHQVLTVYLSTIVFDTSLNQTNVIGICLAMIGSALYTFVKYLEAQKVKSN
ncbi:predicted protein [Naegleria gruberi]|uniref:Predicted protein n=1 Tax=Naegleria gruberi TaxID=5762 RepID=D2VZS1_NAEGR|nr:uncharacterized protein NAEGRDRAFT_74596 [Naegleria gruberi]EFC37707.1 predicted protein [Naegleria gruberi]|eukprot:XP_002670451.1 predicted protein [Naegleria gruberi strain NEG-M]